jgi:protein involved in polysaccharide export with SLBB domain
MPKNSNSVLRIIYKILFILSIIISCSNIQAQNMSDLSTLKVDNLSDEQIKQLVHKAQSSGMDQQQLEAAASARGMSDTELQKLRDRISKLNLDQNIDNQQTQTDANRTRTVKGKPEEPKDAKTIKNKGQTTEKDKLTKKKTIDKTKEKTKVDAKINEQGQPTDQTITDETVETEEESLLNESVFGIISAPTELNALEQKIFGFSLFNNENLTFEPSMSLPTPKNYQLGPDDELIIDVWGASQTTYRLTITPEGNIIIPNVGPIYVNGLTADKASERIISRLSSIYSGLSGRNPNTFAQVSLGNIRSIKVSLVGDVRTPGTYTLPSLATVFNALYVSGGPSVNGSFRNIKVFRDNKLVTTLDVYNFLINGDQKDNIRLQDQDIIMVKPYTIRVEIQGEIKRPALYEVTEKETLNDLITFAAGFTEKAYSNRLKIIRNTPKEHKIVDVPISDFSTFKLENGDLITVDPILGRFENRVEITGAVFRPGQFELTDSLTVKELVLKAEGLRGDAFKSRAIIYRTKDDYTIEAIPVDLGALYKGSSPDIKLQKEDILKIFSIFDLQEDYTVKVDGEVLSPGTYPFVYNSSLEDMIATAGGFKESAALAHIEIARRVKNSYADTTSSQIAKIYSFTVSKDLTLTDSASSFMLQPFDIIFIRRSPGYEEQTLVSIIGEVNFPGSYSLSNKNERISDIIKRSGGLTNDAYIKGAKLIRTLAVDERSRKQMLKMLEYQSDDSVIVESADNSAQTIGINLEEILKKPHSKADILLEQGDVLRIPKELQTVRLTGALLYPITARYDQKYGFRKYVALGGGFSENANPKKAFVVYANGTVDRTRHFLFFTKYPKVEPGSEIIIPQKPERKDKMSKQEVLAVSTAMSSLALIIVSIINASK